MGKKDFNLGAHIFLVLSIFAVSIEIINSILEIRTDSMFGYGVDYANFFKQLVINVAIIISAIFTYRKSSIALKLLVFLFIIRTIICIPSTGSLYSYYLGSNFAILLRDFGPFAIAMCFKKNGISGWKSMLGSSVISNEINVEDIEEDFQEIVDYEDIHKEDVEQATASQESDFSPAIDVKDNVNNSEDEGFRAYNDELKPNDERIDSYEALVSSNVKKKRIIFIALFLIATLSGLFYYYYYNSKPERQMKKVENLLSIGNYKKAEEVLSKLSDNDYIPAQTRLASLYSSGDTLSKNIEKAVALFEKSANLGDTVSLYWLGRHYLDIKDYASSYKFLEKGWDNGSLNCLQYMIEKSMYLFDDNYFSLDDIKKYADKGVKYFPYLSYYAYAYIAYMENDYDVSFYWISKSAELNFPAALRMLGWFYMNGVGCDINYKESYDLFQRVILKEEDQYVYCYLAEMYEKGLYVNKDIEKAIDYYKRAADLGNKDAIRKYTQLTK